MVGITNSMDMSLSKLQEIVKARAVWHAAVFIFAPNKTYLREKGVTEDEIDSITDSMVMS